MSAAEPGCEATILFLGIELGRCLATPAAPYIGGCEHEHVKHRQLCSYHSSIPEGAVCRECFELPEPHAHECAITLTPAGARLWAAGATCSPAAPPPPTGGTSDTARSHASHASRPKRAGTAQPSTRAARNGTGRPETPGSPATRP